MERKSTTSNGRFGASGAVARPKVCTNLQVLRPSERQCKPRLRQAAGTLCVSGGQCSGTMIKNKKDKDKENEN